MDQTTEGGLAFGRALAVARQTKGLTQHQLAEIVGMDSQTVSNWERGLKGVPPYATLVKLNDGLGLPKGWLLVRAGLVDCTAAKIAGGDPALSKRQVQILLNGYLEFTERPVE